MIRTPENPETDRDRLSGKLRVMLTLVCPKCGEAQTIHTQPGNTIKCMYCGKPLFVLGPCCDSSKKEPRNGKD
jgi:DNA-directed RNA polymerase subunit RPC12/RpoP